MRATQYYDAPMGETLLNCTIYDCTYGWANYRSFHEWMAATSIINNIFSSVDYPLMFYTIWPEENDYFGPWFTLRNNCFHNYTALAYRLSDGATKTYAELAAMNQVDAAGDLDATDPLLTAPGSDDFSLQAASPCRHAGHGSGVVEDYLGTAFDKYHPDIGGWSSGAAVRTSAPTFSARDDGTGSAATLDVDGADAQDTVFAYYRRHDALAWTYSGSRVGPGSLQVTGLTTGMYEFLMVASRLGDVEWLPSVPTSGVWAVVTDGAAGVSEALHNVIRARFKTLVADEAPGGRVSAATTVSASAADNSFNDATEDLSVFAARQQVLVSGFTESANNGYFTVVSAAANKLVVSDGTLVDEALGDAVTIRSALPTQYDNDGAFERPEGSRWCRLTILPGEAALAALGDVRLWRANGVAVAQVFVPMGSGDWDALRIADKIVGAFRGVTASGVRFRSPATETIGRDGREWQLNVSCPFQADDEG